MIFLSWSCVFRSKSRQVGCIECLSLMKTFAAPAFSNQPSAFNRNSSESSVSFGVLITIEPGKSSEIRVFSISVSATFRTLGSSARELGNRSFPVRSRSEFPLSLYPSEGTIGSIATHRSTEAVCSGRFQMGEKATIIIQKRP